MNKVDFHIHTTWSDGAQTLPEMLNAAEACGLQTIAITDHFRNNPNFKISDYRQAIDKVRWMYPFEILVGLELTWDADIGIDFLSGEDNVSVDICLCELMTELVFNEVSIRYEQERKEKNKLLETVFDTYCKMAEQSRIDVIAHPFNFGRMALEYDFQLQCLPRYRLFELAELMRQNNVAYELQSQFYYWYPKMRVAELLAQQVEVVKIFADAGVELSIGSDAHNVGTVGNTCWSERIMQQLDKSKVKIIQQSNLICT